MHIWKNKTTDSCEMQAQFDKRGTETTVCDIAERRERKTRKRRRLGQKQKKGTKKTSFLPQISDIKQTLKKWKTPKESSRETK
jgi:hypothetical protein